MELDRYRTEMDKLKDRRQGLERAAGDIERRTQQEADDTAELKHLDQFCRRVSTGLDTLTFEERQQLLRLVVEKVTVDDDRVSIETIIPTRGDDGQLRAPHPVRHPDLTCRTPTPRRACRRAAPLPRDTS